MKIFEELFLQPLLMSGQKGEKKKSKIRLESLSQAQRGSNFFI